MKKNTFSQFLTIISILIGILFLTTCDVFAPGLGNKIDLDLPVVGIESHGNGDYVGGVITLSGYASDDAGISNIFVSHENDSFEAEYVGEEWSLIFDTSSYTDGDYEITISATDTSGKVASFSMLLVVDNSPPSVLVTVPTDYGVDQDFNKFITIKGEAADTTRVDQVFISLYRSSDNAPVFIDEQATGSSSWYYIFDAEAYGGLLGNYYFNVRAVDPSGNSNSYFYHFEDVLAIAVDPGKTPNIEEINGADFQGIPVPGSVISAPLSTIHKTTTGGERMEINIDPDSDKPQFTILSPSEGSLLPSDNIFSTPQRISGFVEDDDLAGIDESTLTLTIFLWSDGTETPVASTPAVYDGIDPNFVLSGNQWTYTAALPDEEYGVKLEVEDALGTLGESNPVPFQVSSFAPVVTITDPTQGTFVSDSGSITIDASITGLGGGSEVWLDWDGDNLYEYEMTETPPASSNWTVTLIEGATVGIDDDTLGTPSPETFEILTDGDFSAKVRAGTAGNYGHATLRLVGDTSPPTGTIDYPTDSDLINGDMTFRGVADDTEKDLKTGYLETVYFHVGTNPSSPVFPGEYTNILQTYNWNSAFDTTSVADGLYTATIIVEDAAGNFSVPITRNFEISQASDLPVLSLSNLDILGAAIDNSLAQDPTIYGKAEDDDNIDYTTLEISVDGGIWNPVDVTDPLSDSQNIDWSHNLTGITQGVHFLNVRVDDENGLSSQIGPVQFTVDYGPPSLSIGNPSNGAIFNNDFTIDGAASDANGLSEVKIIFNGVDEHILYQDLVAPYDQLTLNWTKTFDLVADGFADGDYTYQVLAIDGSGGTTTLDRQLVVDASLPTVTFEQPPVLAVVNGSSVAVQGTVNDNRGVSAVYIDVNPEFTPPPADLASWDTVTGIYSWSYVIDSTLLNNSETPQNFVISVIAVDVAGNESAEYTRMISVDQGSDRPVISFNDIDKSETNATNNVLVGATTLTGIIEDDDLIDPALFSGDAIEISIDGAAWIPVSTPPVSSGKLIVWKHNISALTEGIHTVSVRARDNLSDGTVGLSSVSAEYTGNFNWAIEDSTDQNGVPFILNLGPPTLTIDNPIQYSFHNGDVVIDGTASDANDVSTVEISFDNGSNWTDLGVTPGAAVNWSYNLTVNSDGSDDGTYSYMVRGTDTYGATTIENSQFTVDATDPVVSINLPADGETVNGILNASGTAGDNISLDNVYYHVDLTASPVPSFPGDYTLFVGNYSWSTAIDTTLLANDNYTLRVIAEDDAGNVSIMNSAAFIVDQVSDRPVISFSSIIDGGTFVDNLLPSSKQIAGTITDDDSVDVSTIQYQLYEEDGITEITSGWTDISGPPALDKTLATWTHTFDGTVTDGKYQIRLRTADINDGGAWTVGGFGWSESSLVEFAVDTSNPDTSITSPASNGGYTNQDILINGIATDAGGIKRVEIQFNSDTPITLFEELVDPLNSSESWNTTFTVDTATHGDDGVLNYTVTVTDAYDKIKTIDRYINIDTQPSVINGLVLVNNDAGTPVIVNGSVLIQGSPIDYESLVNAIYIITATSQPVEPGVDPVAEGWTLLGSTTNIYHRFDTTALTDLTGYTTYLVVEDLAGNRSLVTDNSLSFTTTQSGNAPVLTIDTPDASLLTTSGTISGSIVDDDGVNVSTIEIRFDMNNNGDFLDGGLEDWTQVTSHSASNSTSVVFSHSLAVLSEQINRFAYQIRAFDIGEDFADDAQDISPVSTISVSQDVYIDDSDPTAVITQIDNGKSSSASLQGIYINDQFTISGTSIDGVQIADVRAKLAGDVGFVSVTDTNGDASALTPFDTWQWVRSGLAIAGESIIMNLEVEDIHGKITPYNYTLLVDSTDPTVSYISGSGTYHGDFNIRGTSSDNILIDSVYIAHGTSNPAAPVGSDPATDPAYSVLGSTYSWNYTLDTRLINNTDVNQNYYVSIVALDGAGNISSKEDLSIVINQGSDRPNISFTNVTEGAASSANLLESNAKILGSADDDDGLGTIEFATSSDDVSYSAYSVITSDGSTAVTVAGLSMNWQNFVAGLGEGVHYVKFRVRDIEYVDASTPFNEIETASIAFTIDTSAPNVSMTDFDIDDAYGVGTYNKAALAGTLINNSFIVSGSVSDGNSIDSVEISTDGTNYTAVDTQVGTTWSHDLAIIRDGSLDGTMTLYITAIDEFLKSTTISLPVTIDTQEPAIAPTQPTGIDLVDPPNVNGPVTLRGSITEVSAISSFSAIGGTADDLTLTNSGTNLNWVLDIDTDLYSNGSYSVETVPGTSNVWRFPIDISASDAAGNQDTVVYQIDIDPDSDKPTLFLTAPSDGSSVGGAFIVQGTVSDDDDIQKVTLQVDLDDDGVYTSSYDLDLSTTTGDSDFEDESVPVDITVLNGSWNILMNQSNEFNKTNMIAAGYAASTGWIRLRVLPYDVDNSRSGSANLAGDATEIRIYVDSSAPVIEGQGVALPTPANGSIVTGTPSVAARFKDDDQLLDAKMQISFDGGVSYQSITAAGGTITPNGLVGDYYEYDIDLPINTTAAGGIVAGGNGILQAVLKVTDETFKQNTMSIQLNVDNTVPTGVWNYNSDLPDQAGIYSFFGNETDGGDYLLIGSAEDTGTISGIDRVEVYFVKNGKFYNPSIDNSTIENDTLAVTNSSVADMTGTPQMIPYTTASPYIINVDNRTERGIYDTDLVDGDNDGFQENLKSKGTFDEWFVYYDTKKFPDGPMDMYTVVYDTAGNYAYEQVSIQIVNNPPTIDSIEIDGVGTLYSGLFKRAGSVYLKVNASDAEGIDATSYQATVTRRQVAPNGADDATGTPAVSTVFDIADTAGDGADEITIDVSGWEDGVQYSLEIEVHDTDGNIVVSTIGLWVNNTDATAPWVEIDTLSQSNLNGDGTLGHIDEAAFSMNDGGTADADISGEINFTGTAHDDTVVTDVEISFDNGTTWYSVDTLSLNGGDIISGFDYTWGYTINTGDPAAPEATAWTTAALDQIIQVRALDGTNTGILTSGATSSDMSVDVVPYITEIDRTTTSLRTNRSKYGRYSMYQNEANILISGFNLNPTSTGLYNDEFNGGSPDFLTISNIAADFTSFEVATAADTNSGWLGIQVDGVDAINNINDNSQAYNATYGTDGDESEWTDDRYIYFFRVGEYFGPVATSSYNPQHPAMTIHPSTSRLFGAWSSYATSDVFFASVNTDASPFRSRVYHTYDTAEYVDIAMDATTPATTGRLALAWLANNSSDGYYGDGHVSSFPYERSTNFINGDVENDGAANLPANNVQWTRSGFDNWYYQGEGLTYDAELFQFTQVRTARYGANVHWAYYDSFSNTVKYQHQLTSDNSEAEQQEWVNLDGTDTDTDGGENNREVTNGVARSSDAGKFLALTLDEDYYPVVVYYEDDGKTLRLARTGSFAPGNDETLWTRQTIFDPGDPNKDITGKHVSAIVDEQGFLHISFWSEDTGYLYYIKSSNNPEGGAAYEFNNYSQIVDDTGTAGIYSDITLNKAPGTDEPYISYLNSARLNTRDGVKVAFFDSVKGGWEYMVIANDRIVAQKRVSIEYAQGGSPAWNAAIGFASEDRFDLTYLMPEVP